MSWTKVKKKFKCTLSEECMYNCEVETYFKPIACLMYPAWREWQEIEDY